MGAPGGPQKNTRILIAHARAILSEDHPMTVRQVFYRLVSILVLENSERKAAREYLKLSRALVTGRKCGLIPWDWLEDRLRAPRTASMWEGPESFSESVVSAYRLDTWEGQENYFEAWCEKDTLAPMLYDVLRDYGVTLNVGRGYDGWSSIKDAAARFNSRAEDNPDGEFTILYFGDFDPAGEDMVRSLQERLEFFECAPEIVKCALTREDIDTYNLPPFLTKPTDRKSPKFVALHGDMCVELDALPGNVLRDRLRHEVEIRMDLSRLAVVKVRQEADRVNLAEVMEGFR